MNALEIEPPGNLVMPAFSGVMDTLTAARPSLASNGLTGIRCFYLNDVPHLFEAARESMDELCKWMVWCRPDYSLADSAAFVSDCGVKWERGESFSFVIFDAVDGTFLGSAGLSQVNWTHRVANLGYWVRTKHAGRGIASVAARLVARHGLLELGLNRVDILVPVGNRASQRVAEKAGALCEGTLRNRLTLQGKSCDALLYSLAREDYGV